METNYAYPDKSLLPLCYINDDGKVDHAKTAQLIKFALNTFDDVAAHIPASERSSVLHQIQGAAQSFGIAR